MKKRHSKLPLFIYFLPFMGFCQYESPVFYAEKYKDESFVTLRDEEYISIDLKKGEIEIEESITRDFLNLHAMAGSSNERSLRFQETFYEFYKIEAGVYLPEGEKYDYNAVKEFETKDVLSQDVFYDGEKAVMYKLTGVQPGAITHLHYKRLVKEPRFIGATYFKNYSIIESQILQITFDENISLDIQYRNCREEDFEFITETKKGHTTYTWKVADAPKIKDEDDTPGYRSIAPHIIYRIKEYTANGKSVPVLRDVNDLFKWYTTFLSATLTDTNPELDKLVDSITTRLENDSQKAASIYEWVQSNVRYVAVEDGLGGYVPRTASTTFTKRYGDCKDMSTILAYMLKRAGIEAYQAWIGTREIPYRYSEVPSPMVDNHMIAVAKINDDLIYLDATGPNLPFTYPSPFIQDKEALLYVNDSTYKITTVPIVPYSKNVNAQHLELTMDNKLKLHGTGEVSFKGYEANRVMRSIKTKDEKDRKKLLQAYTALGNNTYQLVDYNLTAQQKSECRVSYNFEIENYPVQSGEEVFINLNLERPLADMLIKEDREYPMEFDHAYSIEREVLLQIPEGFKLTYLPESVSHQDEGWGFQINYSSGKNSITYQITLFVNRLLINKDQFEDWNTMIKKLKSDYNETIALERI